MLGADKRAFLPVELAKMPLKNEYGITVVALDEDFRKELEPGAAPVEDRIRALEALAKRLAIHGLALNRIQPPIFMSKISNGFWNECLLQIELFSEGYITINR